MSRSYYHRRHRQYWRTPHYWITLNNTKPWRQATRRFCQDLVKGRRELDDVEPVVQPLPYWD